MPYKDPEKQRLCQARYFQENKDKLLITQNNKRNNLKKYTDKLKQITPCYDCKSVLPPYMMDFDHRPNEIKKFNVSQVARASSFNDLKLEIAKCDIVCANCHRHRTFIRSIAYPKRTRHRSMES